MSAPAVHRVGRRLHRPATFVAQVPEGSPDPFHDPFHHGIGCATHAAIAKEAGVSVAPVFSHFPARETLVRDVLAEVDRFIRRTIVARRFSLRPGVRELDRSHPDRTKVWRDWSAVVRADTWDDGLDFQKRALRAIHGKIRGGIERGSVPAHVDAAAAARIFNGSSHIVALMMFGAARRTDVDRMLTHLVDNALRMLIAGSQRVAG